ncbi:MAG: hypothetical protein ACO1RX_06195 [Candidatus Sericytochromatia bacterium]
MADSASVTPESQTSSAEVANSALDMKQMESQMVSLNFVIKNTQSEVIKLQKTLARYQSRQDEMDKKLDHLERDLSRAIVNQRADESFRSRFWFFQGVTVLVALLLMLLINAVLFNRPAATPTLPETSNTSITTTTTENAN